MPQPTLLELKMLFMSTYTISAQTFANIRENRCKFAKIGAKIKDISLLLSNKNTNPPKTKSFKLTIDYPGNPIDIYNGSFYPAHVKVARFNFPSRHRIKRTESGQVLLHITEITKRHFRVNLYKNYIHDTTKDMYSQRVGRPLRQIPATVVRKMKQLWRLRDSLLRG